MNIYFYTIRPILPNQELLVWYCREFAQRLNYPLTGELMLQRIREQVQQTVPAAISQPPPSASPPSASPPSAPAEVGAVSTTTHSPSAASGASPSESPHKDGHGHYEAAQEGSVRSDEGYHSNGYHDEVLTPPEDSSDSDSENNYVLDFSKKQRPLHVKQEALVVDSPPEVQKNNEFRKVKIKMTKAYHYKAKEVDSGSCSDEAATAAPCSPDAVPMEAESAIKLDSVVSPPPRALSPVPASPTTSKPHYEDDVPMPESRGPSSSILENILLRSRERDRLDGDQNNNKEVTRHATPPPASSSPTEMAYSYKKSHRYGAVPCSPDSSSAATLAPPPLHALRRSPHTPPLSPPSSYSDLGYPTSLAGSSPSQAALYSHSPPYSYLPYGGVPASSPSHPSSLPPHQLHDQLLCPRPPSPAGSLSPDDGSCTR